MGAEASTAPRACAAGAGGAAASGGRWGACCALLPGTTKPRGGAATGAAALGARASRADALAAACVGQPLLARRRPALFSACAVSERRTPSTRAPSAPPRRRRLPAPRQLLQPAAACSRSRGEPTSEHRGGLRRESPRNAAALAYPPAPTRLVARRTTRAAPNGPGSAASESRNIVR